MELKDLDPISAERDQYRIDTRLLRRASARSANSYSQHAQVFEEIGKRLLERLDLLNLSPSRILDLGSGDGRLLHVLRHRYPAATIVGADICQASLQGSIQSGWRNWWQHYRQRGTSLVCMDAGESWPFANGTFDLVISNMLLPWVNETDRMATELERVLAAEGTFFISTAGPDTLAELRHAWAGVDNTIHVNAFLDMHDLGDMFARAGFADPVMDTERIEVQYKDVTSLLTELEATGCGCVVEGRRRGLMASNIRQLVAAKYPPSQRLNVDVTDDSSSISASLELVVAHGWKQLNSAAAPNLRDGEHVVHFQPGTWKSQT